MVTRFPIRDAALRWLETLLNARFGHEWRISRSDEGLVLAPVGVAGAIVFDELLDCLTEAGSSPSIAYWNAENEGWLSSLEETLPAPGCEFLRAPLVEQRDDIYYCHYDILGLAYWMLARIEEVGRSDLDEHGRFPAIASHAFKHGYLHRPVLDEWLQILGQIVARQWPNLILKQHRFEARVSHDVDQPFQYLFVPPSRIARSLLADIVKRLDVSRASNRLATWIDVRRGELQLDPFNTFDWIMDQAERQGFRSAFYFICGRTNCVWDADYEIEHPYMRALLRRIYARGHEIGLHPSYEASRIPGRVKQEFDRLIRVCEQEGIQQSSWGGRMHYLRWMQPETLQEWEEAGLNYDASLGYADRPGFRCGTCHEFRTYDVKNERMLQLVERPLIMMECSVLDRGYMGVQDRSEALTLMQAFKSRCRAVHGQFSLLWHNNRLSNMENELFTRLITC